MNLRNGECWEKQQAVRQHLLDVLAALQAQILAFLLPFVRCEQPTEPALRRQPQAELVV